MTHRVLTPTQHVKARPGIITRSKRSYVLVTALILLVVVLGGMNADALRRWRYARMTTSDLLTAAGREPENLGLLEAAGARLLQDGRPEEARNLLAPSARRHPDDDGLNVLAGRAAWATGHPQEANQWLFAALQANPASADACYWSALVIAARGSKTKAEALLKQAIQLDPNRGDAWSALGEIAYRAGDFPTAIDRLNHADQLTPTEPVALLRAKALKAMGRYGEAEAAARQAVARASLPQDYAILGAIVQLSPEPARLQEAQGYLRAALEKDRNNVDTLELLAISYRRLGAYGQAVRVLRRMLRCQPAMVEGYLLLNQSYRALGKPELAASALSVYQSLEPFQEQVKVAQRRVNVTGGAVPAQLQYARALLELGRRDLAGEVIREAYTKAPDSPELKTLAVLQQGPRLHPIPPLPPDPEGDAPLDG